VLDIMSLAGILAAIGFVVGLLKVEKASVRDLLILLGILVGSFALPTFFENITILGDLFNVVLGVVQGFAVGAFIRLGFELFKGNLKK